MSGRTVSVVIPAYNAAAYLPATLDSVLAQTHRAVEIIVADDGSTDDTVERIAPYRSRIRFTRIAHEGPSAARNAGMRLARGDYIAFLDSDDLWLPEKLAIQVEVAGRHPSSGLIACDGEEFDGDTVLKPRLLIGAASVAVDAAPSGEATGDFHRAFIAGEMISCPAQTLIPRAVVEAVGPLAEVRATDYEYYLRISRSYPVTFHRHRLARWRYRAESLSGPRPGRQLLWLDETELSLRYHLKSCEDPEDRHLLQQRLARLPRERAQGAYLLGRQGGRRDATKVLLGLLRAGRQVPAVLAYLAAVWLPRPVVGAVARLRDRLQRSSA